MTRRANIFFSNTPQFFSPSLLLLRGTRISFSRERETARERYERGREEQKNATTASASFSYSIGGDSRSNNLRRARRRAASFFFFFFDFLVIF
jgi:hypothetical protein